MAGRRAPSTKDDEDGHSPTSRRRRGAPTSTPAEDERPFDSPALEVATDVTFRPTRPGIFLPRPIPLKRSPSSGQRQCEGMAMQWR